MGRIWLEASTLAHTEVNVRKVKKRAGPRKKTTQSAPERDKDETAILMLIDLSY